NATRPVDAGIPGSGALPRGRVATSTRSPSVSSCAQRARAAWRAMARLREALRRVARTRPPWRPKRAAFPALVLGIVLVIVRMLRHVEGGKHRPLAAIGSCFRKVANH